MAEQSLVSLSSLARELGINKSKLAYYNALGLIRHVTVIGGVYTFERKSTLATLKRIVKEQEAGKSLEAIKRLLHENSTRTNDVL